MGDDGGGGGAPGAGGGGTADAFTHMPPNGVGNAASSVTVPEIVPLGGGVTRVSDAFAVWTSPSATTVTTLALPMSVLSLYHSVTTLSPGGHALSLVKRSL
jgi:hypothetical protein